MQTADTATKERVGIGVGVNLVVAFYAALKVGWQCAQTRSRNQVRQNAAEANG
jgi:hypothetical protein